MSRPPRFPGRPSVIRALILSIGLVTGLARAGSAAPADSTKADSTSAVRDLQGEAKSLGPHVRSKLVRNFLAATSTLPSIAPRTVYYDSSRTHFYNADEAAAVPDTARKALISRTLDESFYYTTRYGSPLAYSRPLDILAAAGFDDVAGKKIADFGYGTIGHLRLLASLGARVVGIEVDPLLRALYSAPGDQGAVAGASGRSGTLAVVNGHFPGDAEVAKGVGEGYDLFISKNTLKNGYIHPAEPVDPRRLVHLGVDDTTFVREVYRVLKPGGFAMIYNLCPAPAPPGKPYIPWADGRCPFSESLWKSAGFKVLAFDVDDTKAAHEMAHALGWDSGEGAMNLEKDLFGTYTLVRKPGR